LALASPTIHLLPVSVTTDVSARRVSPVLPLTGIRSLQRFGSPRFQVTHVAACCPTGMPGLNVASGESGTLFPLLPEAAFGATPDQSSGTRQLAIPERSRHLEAAFRSLRTTAPATEPPPEGRRSRPASSMPCQTYSRPVRPRAPFSPPVPRKREVHGPLPVASRSARH
jgi:hypothetical protein